MASIITKTIHPSVPVLSAYGSRMLSTIAKRSLTRTAAGDQKATAAVTNQKARLCTVSPLARFSLVNDSKDNPDQSHMLPDNVVLPKEFLDWCIQLLLHKGASQVIKEDVKLMHEGGFKIGSDGLTVQVYTSGFGHKDLKIEIINGFLVVKGETTDLMGKPLKFNKQIWIPTSDKYDTENMKAESKSGLLKVSVPFIHDEKA
ncbi:heat shock 22 kDa protein, mitochondrial isoform X2 [Tanacetum coccineum]